MKDFSRLQVDLWMEMQKVVTGPLPDIATRFSGFLGTKSHDTLVIFTRECTGHPRKVAGAREIVDRVTIEKLEEINRSISLGDVRDELAVLAGYRRRIWAVRDASDILLVLAPRPLQIDARLPAELASMFGIVAASIHHQVAQASPDYLAGVTGRVECTRTRHC